MTPEQLFSLFLLGVVAAWTPGPNNALVASSGASFGIWRSLPHVAGIGLGFSLMIFLIALGLGEIFQYSIVLREGLRAIGIVILLWLAWRIATSGSAKQAENARRPFYFVEALAFQWINPKAWVMAISITSQYAGGAFPLRNALIIAAMFVVLGLGSAFCWALFGTAMQHLLRTPGRMRVFNWAMAALIVLSVLAIAVAEL